MGGWDRLWVRWGGLKIEIRKMVGIPETNISPENRPLKTENPIIFRVRTMANC